VPQRFFTKFPKKINRVKLSDNRDRNRVNSEIQSGYQKRPFLTHLSPPASYRSANCSTGAWAKVIPLLSAAIHNVDHVYWHRGVLFRRTKRTHGLGRAIPPRLAVKTS
jgi:hypothetical protein